MGRVFDGIDDLLAGWLQSQPVFFVATAPSDRDGSLNCSPKRNRDEFRVLGARRVAYVDQTGSGVETVAHLGENGRIVVMFCAFSGPPRIVRLHGVGVAVALDDPGFAKAARGWPAASGVGVRSIITVDVRRVADSCGYGVPLMTFDQHRPTMDQWCERKGRDGIRAYWADNNALTIDGRPTGLPPC
jgi:hypothetical protein